MRLSPTSLLFHNIKGRFELKNFVLHRIDFQFEFSDIKVLRRQFPVRRAFSTTVHKAQAPHCSNWLSNCAQTSLRLDSSTLRFLALFVLQMYLSCITPNTLRSVQRLHATCPCPRLNSVPEPCIRVCGRFSGTVVV